MKNSSAMLREVLLLAVLLGIALLLRTLAIHAETAWCDEALSAACLPSSGISAYVACAFERDPTIRLAPLYHLVQFAWSTVFGSSLVSLRMLSIALSAIAILQIYALARSFASPVAARWAVLFVALSLFHVYYAQEVRVYALLNVLALGSIQALWAYANGRTGAIYLSLLCNAALLLTHSFTVVFVLAQGLMILLSARSIPAALRWIAAHAGLACAFVLWILLIGYDLGEEGTAFVGAPAGIRELAAMALQFAGARFSNRNPGDYLPGGWNGEFIILLLTAILLAFALIRGFPNGSAPDKARSPRWLLLVWLVVPVLLLFIIGRVWRPCFYPRYLVYSAIPLHLLAAIGLAAIRPALLRNGLAALLVSAMLWQNLALPRPFRADYGAVKRAVESDPAPDKAVLALKKFNYLAVDYALRDSEVEVEQFHGLKEIIGIARERVGEGRSVWAVFYLWSELDAFENAMTEAGFTVRSFESAGMPPLTIFHVLPARGASGNGTAAPRLPS